MHKYIKVLHVPDLIGPSSGSTLTAVVHNSCKQYSYLLHMWKNRLDSSVLGRTITLLVETVEATTMHGMGNTKKLT